VGDEFGKMGGAMGNGLGNGPEVVKGGLSVGIKADATTVNVLEGVLEVGEEAATSWEGDLHAAELAQKLVPGFEWEAGTAANFGKDGEKAFLAMGWELQGHADGIKVPAKEGLEGRPARVAL
jgi:hypothetical protein